MLTQSKSKTNQMASCWTRDWLIGRCLFVFWTCLLAGLVYLVGILYLDVSKRRPECRYSRLRETKQQTDLRVNVLRLHRHCRHRRPQYLAFLPCQLAANGQGRNWDYWGSWFLRSTSSPYKFLSMLRCHSVRWGKAVGSMIRKHWATINMVARNSTQHISISAWYLVGHINYEKMRKPR